jgi:hypothetical protein
VIPDCELLAAVLVGIARGEKARRKIIIKEMTRQNTWIDFVISHLRSNMDANLS